MLRSFLGRRLDQIRSTMVKENGRSERRVRLGRFPGVETLESRALLSGINASGVISSSPHAGGGFDYTIALKTRATSISGIDTFWFAWVPGQDYLASNPVSVTPPAGWTDQVIHGSSGDGYAIEFTAENARRPPSSQAAFWIFNFKSDDASSSVEGNSSFLPGNTHRNIDRLWATPSVVPPRIRRDGAADSRLDRGHAGQSHHPKGQTEQFTAMGTFSNNTTENLTSQVTWASTTTSVVAYPILLGRRAWRRVSERARPRSVPRSTGSPARRSSPSAPPALVSLAVDAGKSVRCDRTYKQFTVTGTFSDITTQDLTNEATWASGTTSVATISNQPGSQGLATAVANRKRPRSAPR